MARLYKHKHRGWQIRYLLYLKDGTQRLRYRYVTTREKALDLFPDAGRLENLAMKNDLTPDHLTYFMRRRLVTKAEAAEMAASPAEIPTLGDLSKTILSRSEIECRPAVHATNKGRVNVLLRYFGEDTPVTNITREQVDAYRAERLKTPAETREGTVSPSTINKEITKLAQMLDAAIENGVVLINHARKARPLKDLRQRKPRALTMNEITRLLEACGKHPELLHGLSREIILIYLYTGMRRSELVFLKCEDIDLVNRRIIIQSDIDPEGFIPKSRRARVIGLARNLLPVIEPFMKTGRKYLLGGDKILEHPNSVTRAFRVLAVEAKLPKSISLHSLRHTYITHLVESGENPRRVQYLAGHAHLSTTEQYLHVLPSEKISEDMLDFSIKENINSDINGKI